MRPAHSFAPISSFAFALLLLSAPLGFGALNLHPTSSRNPDRAIFHSGPSPSSTTSSNWAGWVVTGGSKSVSDVKASWTVPKIQGSCPSSARYSSFWVGIDGYNSKTVEQIGTDSDCLSGTPTYYAWYEFYPHAAHLIAKLTISPGDVISTEVKFASGNFTVKITDITTSTSFSHRSTMSASRSSAEWIAEAPSSGSGVLPLADFGTVQFGKDATGVAGTDTATISGTTGAIGAFSTTVQIDMVSKTTAATKASTGALTPDGTSFNVTWKSAGP